MSRYRSSGGGSFGRMWLLGGLLRGISPRESIGHSEITEDKIPRLHVRRIILYTDVIIAICITLGYWGIEWYTSGDMYCLLYHITPWKRIVRCCLLFATWPGVLYAFAMALITRSREVHNRNWENWRIIRYVTDLAMGIEEPQGIDVFQGLPAVTMLEQQDITEDALETGFANRAGNHGVPSFEGGW